MVLYNKLYLYQTSASDATLVSIFAARSKALKQNNNIAKFDAVNKLVCYLSDQVSILTALTPISYFKIMQKYDVFKYIYKCLHKLIHIEQKL